MNRNNRKTKAYSYSTNPFCTNNLCPTKVPQVTELLARFEHKQNKEENGGFGRKIYTHTITANWKFYSGGRKGVENRGFNILIAIFHRGLY